MAANSTDRQSVVLAAVCGPKTKKLAYVLRYMSDVDCGIAFLRGNIC